MQQFKVGDEVIIRFGEKLAKVIGVFTNALGIEYYMVFPDNAHSPEVYVGQDLKLINQISQ